MYSSTDLIEVFRYIGAIPTDPAVIVQSERLFAPVCTCRGFSTKRHRLIFANYQYDKVRDSGYDKITFLMNTANIWVAQATGKTHDFTLFKESFIGIDELIQLLADSGYQGIIELHTNSQTPFKKSKNKPLTHEQKCFNRELSRKRIVIENINRRIKRFKILSDRYRNKRKRHGLRVTIICALHNWDLGFC